METQDEGTSRKNTTPLDDIEAEFAVILGRPERVADACLQLRADPAFRSPDRYLEVLARLLPLLREHSGPIIEPVFAVFEETAGTCPNPLALVDGMLAARDPALQQRALTLTERLVTAGNIAADTRLALCLAGRVDQEDSRLHTEESLAKIASILRHPVKISSQAADPLMAIYTGERNESLRRLAARILDLGGRTPGAETAAQLLGAENHESLRAYLEYTGAGHFELLQLVLDPSVLPLFVASVRQAEAVCGEALLKRAIAELGWTRLNLGIQCRACVGLSAGNAFPLMLSPAESAIVKRCGEAELSPVIYLFVAHGGSSASRSEVRQSDDPVTRFREYNLAHAAVLADILDVAPLTHEKVARVLTTMDRLVDDFVALFRSYSDECSILPGIYRDLQERIRSELRQEAPGPQLSPELTRLVQMFEDPRSLGGVRTLHGLKRYLHQQGLRLGMRLVGAGHGTNRTVDLLVATRRGEAQALRRVAYVDFEPDLSNASARARIPYPVAALVEGFAHQTLAGECRLPDVKVFCYGNEVHYYLSFANHPAFLRINYAPPLQGGMIDLEYYGVSKYELAAHPNLSLDTIALFLRRLEFDVSIENTRVHARYDKERALDLGDVCAKAEALFRLSPFLMDLDWTIGSLDLSDEARRAVGEAWADFFVRWGVLPLSRFLSSDRKGILEDIEIGPAGEQEVAWSGDGPYRDRYRAPLPPGLISGLRASLRELGLDADPALEESTHSATGQMQIERLALLPLREAVRHGELLETADGFERQSPALFQRKHEAEVFAEILGSEDSAVLAASQVALLVEPLQKALRSRTTGAVNGHEVQRASVPLLGGSLGIYLLRDAEGIIRQAVFARDSCLCLRRSAETEPWSQNYSCDAAELAVYLRRASYVTGREPAGLGQPIETPGDIRERFAQEHRSWQSSPLPGERKVAGLGASPGRAVGRALLGTAGRVPEEFDGAVLVAAFLRPDDTAFLYHAAGIVSTGGGILSHAGLIANQFRKPAMIISGQWSRPEGDTPSLLYRTLEYREEVREVRGMSVSVMRDARERQHTLRDGDIVVLDADAATLRVLGQEREALAFHEESRLLGTAASRLERSREEREILRLRGERLRARHQLGKILCRLADPVLACHAVDEILRGEAFANADTSVDKALLLQAILQNPQTGTVAADHLGNVLTELQRRCRELARKALRLIPSSHSACEVLLLRLEALRLRRTLEDASRWLGTCATVKVPQGDGDGAALDLSAGQRLRRLCESCEDAVREATAGEVWSAASRHLLRTLGRLQRLVGSPAARQDASCALTGRLDFSDDRALEACAHRRVLFPGECGHGLAPLIGWKAANLAEVEMLRSGAAVPPWFVITNRAFEEMLDVEVDSTAVATKGDLPVRRTLREAIDAVLSRQNLDHRQKSNQIQALWDNTSMPERLAAEVRDGCRRLQAAETPTASSEADDPMDYLAIRSSTREEDAEIAARAGEFETFLFIRGEDLILSYLKRAWSGLWTERAIHNRSVLSVDPERVGGGVIVQKIVWSRVSGVLQTSNLAAHETREMVINAALGLGEGVVSGTVAADHVIVMKEGDLEKGPLRFRYVTADKRDRIVFNKRAGVGTIRAETLYHQRLRPALEYVELCELVAEAARLEAAYGYPLDIEFGIEDAQLWILQVRPVTAFLAAYEETVRRYPLPLGVTGPYASTFLEALP
jgi:phosphohistidine swiveling domain-containing protein